MAIAARLEHRECSPQAHGFAALRPAWLRRRLPGKGVEMRPRRSLRDEAAQEQGGRDGTGLKRQAGAIGYSAIRGGTVAGDHDVMFLGPEERLILSHRAESRAIFARGAVTAALWLIGKPPGRYTMADVLGLK